MRRVLPVGLIVAVATVAGGSALSAQSGQKPQSAAESVAAAVRTHLPDGWTCTLIAEPGKMGHPHGLEEPLFRLDFENPATTFRDDIGSGTTRMVHPNLRLHFHAIADRERILRTIEAERVYSWDIPTLFAETGEYMIVSSPLWQNNNATTVGELRPRGSGVYTEEAHRAIAPLLAALKNHFGLITPTATEIQLDGGGSAFLIKVSIGANQWATITPEGTCRMRLDGEPEVSPANTGGSGTIHSVGAGGSWQEIIRLVTWPRDPTGRRPPNPRRDTVWAYREIQVNLSAGPHQIEFSCHNSEWSDKLTFTWVK